MVERIYIYFKPIDQKLKTNIWQVMNKKHNYPLGTIIWDRSWRQYIFITDQGKLNLSSGCMEQMTEFLRRMNKEQKDGKHGKKPVELETP